MSRSPSLTGTTPFSPPRAVVVAASLGGLHALERLLAGIPTDFPAPIVVAHHMPDSGPRYLVELLAGSTVLPVHWARSAEALKPGHVYVAPPGHHITLSRFGRSRLNTGPRHNFVRPSSDLLFRSAADVLGDRVAAVILTGRLRDGAAGALDVRAAGGLVLAQDPATCAAPGMPNAAIATGAVHFVLPPRVIGAALVSLATVPGATELFGIRRAPKDHAA